MGDRAGDPNLGLKGKLNPFLEGVEGSLVVEAPFPILTSCCGLLVERGKGGGGVEGGGLELKSRKCKKRIYRRGLREFQLPQPVPPSVEVFLNVHPNFFSTFLHVCMGNTYEIKVALKFGVLWGGKI